MRKHDTNSSSAGVNSPNFKSIYVGLKNKEQVSNRLAVKRLKRGQSSDESDPGSYQAKLSKHSSALNSTESITMGNNKIGNALRKTIMRKINVNLNSKVHNVRGYKSCLRPVLMIQSGTAIIKNALIPERGAVAELRQGEVIGESDLCRFPGVDFLGDIYAGDNGLECLVILAPEQVIELFERPAITAALKDRWKPLRGQLTNHNKILRDKEPIYQY